MEYTPENIEIIANKMVDDMSLEELQDFVYEDLVSLMQDCKESFRMNVEDYME